MARKTAAYYQRKAAEAERRETYFRTSPARPRAGTTVTQKNTQSFIYRSLFLRTGTGDTAFHVPFTVNVGSNNVTKIGGANKVGLLGGNSTAPEAQGARRIKSSGLHPSTISWSNGSATPVLRTTAWQTTWVQYYDNATGDAQSNYSIPVSQAAGPITPQDILTAYKTIFSDAAKASLLGAKNGSAQLQLEYSPSFFSTNT